MSVPLGLGESSDARLMIWWGINICTFVIHESTFYILALTYIVLFRQPIHTSCLPHQAINPGFFKDSLWNNDKTWTFTGSLCIPHYCLEYSTHSVYQSFGKYSRMVCVNTALIPRWILDPCYRQMWRSILEGEMKSFQVLVWDENSKSWQQMQPGLHQVAPSFNIMYYNMLKMTVWMKLRWVSVAVTL